MRRPSRQSLSWALVGGAAFWLPPIAVYAFSRDRVSLVAESVAALVGIQLMEIVFRVRHTGPPRWWWVLAGIYVLGPLAMEMAAVAGSFPSGVQPPGSWLWLALFALLPPVTLWFATLNGMIISVLITTPLLIFLAGRQQDESREVSPEI